MTRSRVRSLTLYLAGFLIGSGAAVTLGAQAPDVATTDYVVWTQPAPSPAVARTYRYTIRVDGGAATIVTPTCNAATPSGVDCGILNPGPTAGSHTMTVSYAIPLSGGGFTGESPTGTCAWNTVGNPTAPPSNFRWLKLIGGAFVKLFHYLTGRLDL